jgi:catechol 2,3-dioxygenase-like lactoylglutathione lyase family enzyme
MELMNAHLRIARPARDLEKAENFWVNGLGMQVRWRTEGDEPLVMVGFPGAAWHIELVGDPTGPAPSPTEEDLVVLYLGEPASDDLLRRLTDSGGAVVRSRNPYWEQWGVTVEDPDGYRLVLSHRTWD